MSELSRKFSLNEFDVIAADKRDDKISRGRVKRQTVRFARKERTKGEMNSKGGPYAPFVTRRFIRTVRNHWD